MNRNIRCIADHLWDDLVRACKKLGYLPTYGSCTCLEYNRLVFSEKYHLLTFEVNRGRLVNLPNGSSVSSENLDRLRQHFRNVRLDVVDLGPNLYFYFWITSIRQLRPVNLVCT